MISVDQQYALQAQIQGRDFLNITSLQQLVLVEQAGTDLPTFSLSFTTTDNSLRTLINERNPLAISLGRDQNEMVDSEFRMLRTNFAKSGKDSWLITVSGIKSSLTHWSKPVTSISDKQSGIERLLSLVPNPNSNISSSEDSQHWIQTGIPNKQHVDDIWLHCDLPNSFPLLAATLIDFRVMDASTLISGTPDWVFGTGSGDIYFDPEYSIQQQSGFLNSVGARGSSRTLYDPDTGDHTTVTSEPLSLMAMTEQVNASADFAPLNLPTATQSRNVHPRYWETFAHNHTQIALYSSTKVTLTLSGGYIPIHPLDLVMFKEQAIGNLHGESDEVISGLYIVSKVARTLVANRIITLVDIVRESTNEVA